MRIPLCMLGQASRQFGFQSIRLDVGSWQIETNHKKAKLLLLFSNSGSVPLADGLKFGLSEPEDVLIQVLEPAQEVEPLTIFATRYGPYIPPVQE